MTRYPKHYTRTKKKDERKMNPLENRKIRNTTEKQIYEHQVLFLERTKRNAFERKEGHFT